MGHPDTADWGISGGSHDLLLGTHAERSWNSGSHGIGAIRPQPHANSGGNPEAHRYCPGNRNGRTVRSRGTDYSDRRRLGFSVRTSNRIISVLPAGYAGPWSGGGERGPNFLAPCGGTGF